MAFFGSTLAMKNSFINLQIQRKKVVPQEQGRGGGDHIKRLLNLVCGLVGTVTWRSVVEDKMVYLHQKG